MKCVMRMAAGLGLFLSAGGLSTARADMFPFAAYTNGQANSAPFVQSMSGLLINYFDRTECGFANSLLKEAVGAQYQYLPPVPVGTINHTVFFMSSGTVGTGQFSPGLPIQPTYKQFTEIGVEDTVFSNPTLVLGPFTAEQLPRDDLLLPIVGPDFGLVAQTHGGFVGLNVGPVSDPLSVGLNSTVSFGPTDGVGNNPMSESMIAAVDFDSSVTITPGGGLPGAPIGTGFLHFTMDQNGNAVLKTDFDSWALLITPVPFGFDYTLVASNTDSVPVNGNDTLGFTNSMGAQLRTEFLDCVPEPSTLTLLGIGSLSLLGYGWRRRKQAIV